MKRGDARVRLGLLGSWQLEIDGKPRSGPAYKKGRALLAYLVIGKGPRTRQAINDLLWPDSEGHLRRLLSNLRRTLDLGGATPSLLSDGGALGFHPHYPLWADVHAFAQPLTCDAESRPEHCSRCLQRMEDQAALYRGDLLAGFSLPECPEFEDWLQLERESLRGRMLTLLERLWQCRERNGDFGKALVHAQRYVELEPWNEAGQRNLIRLLAANGQQAAALSQFETCQRLLERELGATPEAETLTLVERIRSGVLKPAIAQTSRLSPEPTEAVSEHRLLTVLHCRFDAPGVEDLDDLAEALSLPQQRTGEIIGSCSGHIVLSQRQGILACFGFPLARENAARQAVKAALKIRAAAPAAIAIRIGIHSGIGIAQDDMPDIVGVTAAYAVQMTEIAEAGSVLISEVTERLITGYFRLSPYGTLSRQGMPKHLAILSVEGESGATTRLESAGRLTPLVGRSAELTQLTTFWDQAKHGIGQTVLIRGDAGIGKSRLVHSLSGRFTGLGAVRELRCFPEFCQSPLHPVLALCESLSGFDIGDSEAERQHKLSAYLREHHPTLASEALALIAPLLHLPAEVPSMLPPQQQKQRTFHILLDLLHNLDSRQPLLLIIEDLHWCDPSTLELLEAHVHRQSGATILTLATARPEFQPTFEPAGIMDLAPLSPSEITKLVEHIDGDLPDAAIASIVARADGIPLFAEEMARFSPNQLSGEVTPLTLHELLTARLDGAGEAKSTAWLAATLGREFDLELLRRISPLAEDRFQKAIEALKQSGLIARDQVRTLAFRHALLQEAAYRSQPKRNRQAAHRRIADVLQTNLPETAEKQPEIVARHLTEGGELPTAVGFWLKAGRKAALQSAHLEAAAHFKTGLSVLEKLPDDENRNRLELQLQAALGGVLIALKGYGSEEAKRHFTRAAELGRGAGDEAELFPVIYGLWLGGQSDTITVAPLALAEKLMQIAQRSGDPIHTIAAHYAHGNNLFWLGRHQDARQHLETVLSAFTEIPTERLIAELGEDTRVSCRSFLAWIDWFQGYPDRARMQIDMAISQAKAAAHAHSQGFALTFSVTLHRHLGMPQATEAISLELLKLAEHHDLGLWTAVAYTAQGWAMAAQGNTQAIGQIEQGVASVRVAMKLVDATITLYLIDALHRLRRHRQALDHLDRTIAQAMAWEDNYLLAEFFRLKAEALLALNADAAEEAEGLLHQSLETARQQRSLMLELRAAITLAQLWRNRGDPERASSLLNATYGQFSEGFDTPDLKAAAALLHELTG